MSILQLFIFTSRERVTVIALFGPIRAQPKIETAVKFFILFNFRQNRINGVDSLFTPGGSGATDGTDDRFLLVFGNRNKG